MQLYSEIIDLGVIFGLLALVLSILYRLRFAGAWWDTRKLNLFIGYLVLTPVIGLLVLPDTTAVPHKSYLTQGFSMVDPNPHPGLRRTAELRTSRTTVRTYGTFVFEHLGTTALRANEPPIRGDVTFSLVSGASEWPRYTHFVQSTLMGDEHTLNAWLRDAIATCADHEGSLLRTTERQDKRIEAFRARMLGCLSTVTDPHAIHAVSLEVYFH
jgi:hypothetical protein